MLEPIHNVLVCVTQQKTCERLIRKAGELSEHIQGDLFIIHVAKNEWNFLDNIREGEALEYLFGISKSVGANLTVLKSNKIVEAIVSFAREHSIRHIVVGQSPNDHKENNFYRQLRKQLPNVEIQSVPHEDI